MDHTKTAIDGKYTFYILINLDTQALELFINNNFILNCMLPAHPNMKASMFLNKKNVRDIFITLKKINSIQQLLPLLVLLL